jgi:phenylacetate-coenzyme A ligase PaaK-like adenylate-forming protein
MNLFFAGGLYGGFVSFFTVLETLKAVQFPMAGYDDTKLVADTIVSRKCNVLLGMPSYIIRLFNDHADLMRKHKVVEKIFYGGEHFNESQKRYFHDEFGVKLIRSGAYGSVDAGPIGYQCHHCTGSVHHLHSRLHVLEILDPAKDEPVPSGQPGRVVLSSLARHGQRIQRYDIGDIARLIESPCPCGRLSPRFELLGRHGDVFKIGSAFFNYGKIAQIFAEEFNYAGEMQIVLRPGSNGGMREELCILVSPQGNSDSERFRAGVLENYSDLREVVQQDKVLDFKIDFVGTDRFQRTISSGKLKHVIDERVVSVK